MLGRPYGLPDLCRSWPCRSATHAGARAESIWVAESHFSFRDHASSSGMASTDPPSGEYLTAFSTSRPHRPAGCSDYHVRRWFERRVEGGGRGLATCTRWVVKTDDGARTQNGHIRNDTRDVARRIFSPSTQSICRRNCVASDRACTRVTPLNFHGKEGVDGSSPSEGCRKNTCKLTYCVAWLGASCTRGYETGTHSWDWRAFAGKRDVWCRFATHLIRAMELDARGNPLQNGR